MKKKPIDMVLYCPSCQKQHIDEIDPVNNPGWDNPVHTSHKCLGCFCVFRPADVPTNGVRKLKTKGKSDTWVPGETVIFDIESRGLGDYHFALSYPPPATPGPTERVLQAYAETRRHDIDARFYDTLLPIQPIQTGVVNAETEALSGETIMSHINEAMRSVRDDYPSLFDRELLRSQRDIWGYFDYPQPGMWNDITQRRDRYNGPKPTDHFDRASVGVPLGEWFSSHVGEVRYIADDRQYRLYQERYSKTYWAGCRGPFTRAQALSHWNFRLGTGLPGDITNRAQLFLSAILKYSSEEGIQHDAQVASLPA